MKFTSKALSVIFVLIAVTALTFASCGNTVTPTEGATESATEDAIQRTTAPPTQIGSGATSFTLSTIDGDDNLLIYRISTDKKVLSDAMIEAGLISQDDAEYIKTIGGVTADFEKDGSYWAFFIGDNYATESAAQTEIEDGADYWFKVQK